MAERALEMVRSVSQLLFSYLPERTVSWEDGGGVVRLGTPRLESAWPPSEAAFVLREIGEYLERWRARGGVVDSRYPPVSRTDRFTVGTPRGISAALLRTAFYCRNCFRFLPRLRVGANRLQCPECRRATLRQVSYVFVHGCGELTPIRAAIPYESTDHPGTIFWGPIRCRQCADGGVLRIDARSERLSALRIVCDRCSGEVIGRPLARCPFCLPRLFHDPTGHAGQLAFRTAMRITRHSANNAYYPHSITILRLDRPRTLQVSEELDWLQTLLPRDERAAPTGVAATLSELVERLARAEAIGDNVLAAEIRATIAGAAAAPPAPNASHAGGPAPTLQPDVLQGVRESIALLSTVRRTSISVLYGGLAADGNGRTLDPTPLLQRLGLRKIEVVEDLPVITAVFGYSRRSPDPDYQEERAAERFPTTLRPFPTLDDDAARVLGKPQASGTTPILAREGAHEGFALYLSPESVLEWLEKSRYVFAGDTTRARIVSMLQRLEPVDKFGDEIWRCPLRRLVFGLLHSLSHCAMRALGRTAGLEETSTSEYIFLPLLSTVVYSTASTPLGGVRATARDRLVEFLETLQREAMRCLYDPDCLQRAGACHGCIHVPEIGCRVFNHGLSRAFLIGGHAPWASSAHREAVPSFWAQTAQVQA